MLNPIQSQAKKKKKSGITRLASATFQHWVLKAYPLKLSEVEEGCRVLFQRRMEE